MTPIERVARALCACRGADPDKIVKLGFDQEIPAWRMDVEWAAAAIQALREPSEAMIDAGVEASERQSVTAIYKACIKAALDEG